MLHVLILAAGQGKRMHSALPKVLHTVLHRPMLHHVIRTAQILKPLSVSIVVGHGEEKVREACEPFSDLHFFSQKEQRGTAHAVMMAESHLNSLEGQLIILYGDVCLLKTETLEKLIETHKKNEAVATVLTAKVSNPTGYGRILRNPSEEFSAIREHGDCSEAELKTSEINSGIYCFDVRSLRRVLTRISNKNKQGEYYLTDSIELLASEKNRVVAFTTPDPSEIMGINDRLELALAEKILQERTNHRFMRSGVSLHQPETISIDPMCQIGEDTSIESGCTLINCEIGRHVVIESGSRIIGSKIAPGTRIKQGSYIEDSEIGMNCTVGPYAHLRPGSHLLNEVKIGNFVETKKIKMKSGAKASHLTYLGDADIGENVNIGCGFITCNFDGVKKHKTVIEDDVFIGSDSQAVAPVTIGKGAFIAAGTTITKDVPAGSLAVSRGKQSNKDGYAKKFPKK